jgi:hypothetical protein
LNDLSFENSAIINPSSSGSISTLSTKPLLASSTYNLHTPSYLNTSKIISESKSLDNVGVNSYSKTSIKPKITESFHAIESFKSLALNTKESNSTRAAYKTKNQLSTVSMFSNLSNTNYGYFSRETTTRFFDTSELKKNGPTTFVQRQAKHHSGFLYETTESPFVMDELNSLIDLQGKLMDSGRLGLLLFNF